MGGVWVQGGRSWAGRPAGSGTAIDPSYTTSPTPPFSTSNHATSTLSPPAQIPPPKTIAHLAPHFALIG